MKYYTCSRTAGGFANFTDDNIFDIKKVIFTQEQNLYRTDLILSIIKENLGTCEEIIVPGYKNLKSGLISRNKSVAVLSHRGEIQGASSRRMYKCFEEAKKIHDEWEKIYINKTNYATLNSFCSEICRKITGERSSEYGTGKCYKRFFGTSTKNGPINYIDELTQDINKRYFIKGRPGTGKSTFLKRLSADSKKAGFDVEEYYCSFDKNSLDMVVIRELSVCVFDSTPPHEKFPERGTDEILDFYKASCLEGTDELMEHGLTDVRKRYNKKMAEGAELLKSILVNEEDKPCEPSSKEYEEAEKIIAQF